MLTSCPAFSIPCLTLISYLFLETSFPALDSDSKFLSVSPPCPGLAAFITYWESLVKTLGGHLGFGQQDCQQSEIGAVFSLLRDDR